MNLSYSAYYHIGYWEVDADKKYPNIVYGHQYIMQVGKNLALKVLWIEEDLFQEIKKENGCLGYYLKKALSVFPFLDEAIAYHDCNSIDITFNGVTKDDSRLEKFKDKIIEL